MLYTVSSSFLHYVKQRSTNNPAKPNQLCWSVYNNVYTDYCNCSFDKAFCFKSFHCNTSTNIQLLCENIHFPLPCIVRYTWFSFLKRIRRYILNHPYYANISRLICYFLQISSYAPSDSTNKDTNQTACANFHTGVDAVSVHCRHPVTPGCDAIVSSAAACSVRRTAHALLCIDNGDDSAVFFSFFVPGDLDFWSWHLNSGEIFVQRT